MPQRNTVEIIINSTDNASDAIRNVVGGIQNIGETALAITGAALAGATTAVLGFSAASLSAFSEFQTGMNMIFTNLPGITEDAMRQMETQVQNFMEQTGRSAEEATAAIYDALSAGIPKENIYEFMNTANMVAIGGVTDLGSAVDGLTSVVNAYGSDVIGVTEASDIMFETARLGKTTISELSAYLFQVVPSAAAVGVSFEDIGASLAVITAQGVPTSVAANAVQKAILELAQAGSEASDAFTEAAGVSFPEFIAQGNTMADAMQLMENAAREAGIPINQMFGSVEAGQAALALTGANMDNFIDATDAMGNSAGATERAFNTMNEGLGVAMAKLGARWESLMISMGRVLEPFVTPLVDAFSAIVAYLAAVVDSGDTMNDWLTHVPTILQPFVFAIGELANWLLMAADAFGSMVAAIQAGVSPMAAFQNFLYTIAGAEVAQAFEDFVYWVGEIGRVLGEALAPVIEWIGANVEISDVLIALGVAIASVVIPAIIGFFAAFAPLAALIAAIALLRTAWEENWGGIQEKTAAVIDWVTNTAWPALLGFFENIANAWNNIIWPGLQAFWDWFMVTGLPAIMDFIDTEITPRWELFVSIMGAIWETVSGAFGSFFNWFMTDGLAAIMDFIDTEITPRWELFVTGLSQFWDMVSTSFGSFFNWFMTDGLAAIMDWIDTEVIPRWELFQDLMAGIWTLVEPGFNALRDGAIAVLDAITAGLQTAADAITNLQTTLSNSAQGYSTAGNAIGQIGSGLASGEYSVGDVFGAFGNALFGGNQFGGYVKAGVPSWVGEQGRELFVPSSDGQILNNRDSELAAEGGGKGMQIIINVYGAISDEQANESVYKLKRELSAQGITL